MVKEKPNQIHGREKRHKNTRKSARYGANENTKKSAKGDVRNNKGKHPGRKQGAVSENTIEKNREAIPVRHVRDVNSREIFKNEKLVCQFLRDYTDIPIFSDIRPEDIKDVTSRYRAYLGVEFETDTVKRVRVRVGEKQREVYVISLIEHKSSVDYDVAMQLLRYMAVIWYDYGKRQNRLAEQSGLTGSSGKNVKSGRMKQPATSRKSFRYPLIIPIVYYEGSGKWTADMNLWERIELGGEMREYIPDFSYKVIRLHNYSNADIQRRGNEMSLVFMFNRIQSPEDYSEFIKNSKEYMAKVLADTSPELMEVLLEVFWALLMKMNVPQEEAEEMVENLEVKNVGYLFENAEKMDIQAERRNTRMAQERAEAAEAQVASEKARAEDAIDSLGRMLGGLAGLCRDAGFTKEETKKRLHDYYRVSEPDLEKYFEVAWQGN